MPTLAPPGRHAHRQREMSMHPYPTASPYTSPEVNASIGFYGVSPQQPNGTAMGASPAGHMHDDWSHGQPSPHDHSRYRPSQSAAGGHAVFNGGDHVDIRGDAYKQEPVQHQQHQHQHQHR